MKISQRDRGLLRFVGEQSAASYSTLSVLLGNARMPSPKHQFAGNLGLRGVQRVVKRWRDSGVVETWRPLADVSPLVRLTTDGALLVGLDSAPPRPRLGTLMHCLIVAHTRATLEASKRVSGGVVGKEGDTNAQSVEPAKLPIWISQSQLWKFGLSSRGPSANHWPDAALVTPGQFAEAELGEILDSKRAIAVEVERTSKSKKRYVRILRELATHWRGALYLCTSEPVLRAVQNAVQESLAKEDQKRISVKLIDQPEWSVRGYR